MALIETADQFVGGPAPHSTEDDTAPARDADRFRRYWVNLLVDHGDSRGAPVVYEDHPAFQNLVGRIEYIPQLGALVYRLQSHQVRGITPRERRLFGS